MKKQDDITEFVQLLTSHQEVLRSYITSMLPNYQHVNDVLQDVNVKLWERQKTFESGTNFGAWACTMARYSILSHRAKLKQQGWLIFSDELVEKLVEPSSKDSQPSYLDGKREALHTCLKKLKPKERELLKIRYQEGMSLVDYAEKIGSTPESMRVTLHRIRMSLKKCVTHHQLRKGDAV